MIELLLIVPHPDDEVFGSGGLFAKMAADGRKVATLTLTKGGAGLTLELCSREEIEVFREAELRASLDILGVKDIFIWDYPDYVPDDKRGMDLRSGLSGISQEKIVNEIVELLDRLEPITILTFPPNGSNGHPDHVMTNRFVLSAINKAKHKVQKLYYFSSSEPYSRLSRDGFLSAEEIIKQQLHPSHYIELDVDGLEQKLAAMAEHKTQALSVLSFMRLRASRLHLESFYRALPELEEDQEPKTVMWL